MKTYNLKFIFSYIECDYFKEKELILLRNFISGARLGKELKFDTYASVSFNEDDRRHDLPIVTEMESFTRTKINGVLFNMEESSLNNGVYNKCLIYQTVTKNGGAYGYVFFNSETGAQTHQFNIEYDLNSLIKHIYSTLQMQPSKPKIQKMLDYALANRKQRKIA